MTNVTPFTKEEDRTLPKKAVGAFLVTKHGERLPFWPKLFPHDAVNRFFALARNVCFPPKAAIGGFAYAN